MEILMPEAGTQTPPNLIRVCPFCATLAWNNEDGSVEAAPSQAVSVVARSAAM